MEEINRYIDTFWEGMKNSRTVDDYKQLLSECVAVCLETLSSLEGVAYDSFFEQAPLLAMISEIEQKCPNAVEEMAKENEIIGAAYSILKGYDKEERDYLRRVYLKVDDKKVIYLDFKKDRK